jgi:hypothetical protein
MSQWNIAIGYALLVLGLVMLSPLSDLLPVDLWYSLKSLVSAEEVPYQRVVSTSRSEAPFVVTALLGLILVVLGKTSSSRRKE